MVHESEDQFADVQDDGVPILPGWRDTTHTCNDVYQVKNKIQFQQPKSHGGQLSCSRFRLSFSSPTEWWDTAVSQQNQVPQCKPGTTLWRLNWCSS